MLDYLKLPRYCHNSIKCKTEQYVHYHLAIWICALHFRCSRPVLLPTHTHTLLFSRWDNVAGNNLLVPSVEKEGLEAGLEMWMIYYSPQHSGTTVFFLKDAHTQLLCGPVLHAPPWAVSQEHPSFPHLTLQKIRTTTLHRDSDPYSLLKSLVTCPKTLAVLQQLAFLHYWKSQYHNSTR